MATKRWKPKATPRAQVTRAQVANVGVGDTFTLSRGGVTMSVVATAASEDNVYDLFAAASKPAAFSEITFARSYNGTNGLFLTGASTGAPFTLTGSTADGSTPAIVVTETTKGVAGVNQQQQIEVTATGGNFKLSFLGAQTANIAYNANAATVQTALQGLSTIGSGNATVAAGTTSGNTRRWVVTFTGALAANNWALLVADGTGLTGVITGNVVETVKGASGANHKYQLTIGNLNGVHLRLKFTHPVTGVVAYTSTITISAGGASLSPATLQSALANLATIGAGNVSVVRTSNTTSGGYNESSYVIEFIGALAGTDVTPGGLGGLQDNATNVFSGSMTLTETQQGSGVTTNEKQTISFSAPPGGGTFTATFGGQTTSALAYNISASSLQTALQGLSSIGSGNCTVTATTSGGLTYWLVEFTNARGATDQPMITIDATSITGGPATVTQIQQGSAAVNEAQTVTVSPTATAGTFTLTFGANTTGTIAWNASATTVEAALLALASIGSGNVSVAGSPGGPWLVTFTGSLGGTDVAAMTGDGSGLSGVVGTQSITLSASVEPTGPEWWSEPLNWSSGSVPVNSDDIYVDLTDGPIKWGIDQASLALTSLWIRSSDDATAPAIGLPERRASGLLEPETRYLKLGATTCQIDVGEGLVNLEFTGATTCDIKQGPSGDGRAEGTNIKGGHSTATFEVVAGECNFARFDGDTFTASVARIGPNAVAFVGAGSTVTTRTYAGEVTDWAQLSTTLTVQGGTTTTRGALNSVAATVASDGTWNCESTGTATSVSIAGSVDCSTDTSARNFGNLTLKQGGQLLDPYETITATYLRAAGVRELTAR